MRAAAQALMTLAVRRLSARIGLIAVLHTWGQTLTHHAHVHCLVPVGGFVLDGGRWVDFSRSVCSTARAASYSKFLAGRAMRRTRAGSPATGAS